MMDMDPRIKELREILEQPIDWYNKNKSDPGLVYDELYCQFSSLSRGDFVRLIETVLEDEGQIMDAMTAAVISIGMIFLILISFVDWKIPSMILGIVLLAYATLIGFYVLFKWLGLD